MPNQVGISLRRPDGSSLASSGMALRAWLFDLDDTLIPEAPAIRAGYEAVAERVWGQSTPERVRQLTDAAHEVWRAGAPWEYKERVHFSLGEGLHGEFVADGPEPDRLRQFIPRLHEQAFEAVLPDAQPGQLGRARRHLAPGADVGAVALPGDA